MKWIALLCVTLIYVGTATASTPATHYASLFKSTYNAEAKANGWPHRVIWMSCVASKSRGYYDCGIKINTRGRTQCGAIVIDTAFDVLENHIVPCKSVAPAQATA